MSLSFLKRLTDEVPGQERQSVLLVQEEDISYQTSFFLLGVIFSETMKQTK